MALRERSRRSPDERPGQILDAAVRTLLARGLAGTTVAEVAEAAGVAKGTVYLYFDSKAHLLTALRARYTEQFLDTIAGALDSSEPGFSTRLDRFVEALFEFSLANRDLHHVLFHEAGVSEENAFAGLRGLLADFIAGGVAAGEFAVTRPDAAADFLVHGLHGVLVALLHGHGRRTARAAARDLARQLLGAARAARPALDGPR